jgi:imidazolonepropionase-like amidohydrolase
VADKGRPGDFWPSILAVQERLRSGSLTGPRLHVLGPVVEGLGGHPAETICGGDAWCRAHLAVEVDDPAVATARVRAIAGKGIIGFKAVYSGPGERVAGKAAPGDMAPAVLDAIARAAHELGLRLAVHENYVDRALDAIERGARVLAHTPYSEPIAGTALLDRLVGDRSPTITTLWVAGPPLRDPTSELWARRLATRKANVKALLDAGGLVVFGTDNAFIDVGEGIRLEIEALTSAGFAPADIINSLTRNGAEFLGLEAEQGTIEVSKLADLVVVRGDPLQDSSSLTDVALVVKGGKVFLDRRHEKISTKIRDEQLPR